MHILIATPAFPPFIGGGERHTGTLASHLIVRGHRVSVLTSQAKKESDFWNGNAGHLSVETPQPGLLIIRAPIKNIPGGWNGLQGWRKAMVLISEMPGSLGLLRHMARFVPRLQQLDDALGAVNQPVDVVHGFNISWEHTMMEAGRYARENQLPFIASPLAHLGTGPNDRVAKNSTMRHQKALLESADLLITNTALEAQGLIDRGIKVKGFQAAGPGVDMPKNIAPFPDENISLKPYVLFIGRANIEKGAMHAAEAIIRLRHQGVDIHLVMIGQETPAFNQFYKKLSPEEQAGISHLGLLDESLKHVYLKDARALLLPSRTDSFGIVLLESWLYSRPVIAAKAGGIPAVVDDGENGILVPYGDVEALASAVRRLVEDSLLNMDMGQKGHRKLMAQYTWDAVTDIVEKAYEGAIHSHSH